MKLSISNIAWPIDKNEEIYIYLKDSGYSGLEIAPTKIVSQNPYDHSQEAKTYTDGLREKYGLKISSLQSIWYGINEKIFKNEEERKFLIDYTKKAILFAEKLGAGNLVFGCPRNRVINGNQDIETAVEFFYILGEYAYEHHTNLALEPNPTIYNTNFINYTLEAFELVKRVKSKGLKVNIDIGTMIYNNEEVKLLNENFDLINHVHISEPGLVPIEFRKIHEDIIKILRENKYTNYVSVEMSEQSDISKTKRIIDYVKRLSETC